MSKDVVVMVKVEDLQKLMDTLDKALHPSVQFSRDPDVMRERAMDATDSELNCARGLVEIMMHP
jgi:hypothetical protein